MSTIAERVRVLLSSIFTPSADQLEAAGGSIDAGEAASLLFQRIIRRWVFLGLITAITTYTWAVWDPIWRQSPANVWNFFLSYLAIFIEGVVGKFFFAQSMRDARIIRAILRELVEHVRRLLRQVLAMSRQNLRMEREHGRELAALRLVAEAQVAEVAQLRTQVSELHAVIVGGASVRRRGPDGRFVSVKSGENVEKGARAA